jgi:hypothetical protein
VVGGLPSVFGLLLGRKQRVSRRVACDLHASFTLVGATSGTPCTSDRPPYPRVARVSEENVTREACLDPKGRSMDLKLEVVPIPVADIDAAKAFYIERVGFHLTTTRVRTSGCGLSR